MGLSNNLDSERLVFADTESHAFTLCVKGVEVDVRNDSERV